MKNDISVVACCILTLLNHAVVPVTSRKQPHIVFVLADDLGYHDVGFQGSEIKTPTLDGLVSQGLKLDNYYVQPICTPSRSQLMSGRYQIHTGLQHLLIGAEQPNALPDDSPTIADKLKEAGYSTNMVGKWHLGHYKEKYLPYRRGFDTFYGYYLGALNSHYSHNRTCSEDGMSYLDLHTQDGPVWTEMGHYSTHLFTERAVDVINKHNKSDQPLFLYLAYQAPHTPLEVPAQYEQQYGHINDTDRRTYAGMVTCMDEGIGNLTSALRAAGMWDDTVFVFSTDNGGLPSHGASNFPLKGGKSSLWEGGVRGVGMMAGGAVNTRGVHQGLMHISDWFPTLVNAAGGNIQGTLPLDGVDQWSSLHGGAAARTTLLHNIDPLKHPSGKPMFNGTFDTSVRAALRVGDMKLITGFPDRGGKNNHRHHNDNNQKRFLIQDTLDSSTKNVWLFNITADPREETDLSDVMPGQVKTMLDTLQKFSDSAVPPRYPPDDPQSNPGLRLDVWGPWM